MNSARAPNISLALCDCRVGVMRGAKWLVRHKMATLASDLTAISDKPRKPLESWDFADYIRIAKGLNIINENTATQAHLAREFRNLIHPGRAQRTGQACDKATAFSPSHAIAVFDPFDLQHHVDYVVCTLLGELLSLILNVQFFQAHNSFTITRR